MNTNTASTGGLRNQLSEAADRLMENYRDIPKYPADKKRAKRTSYRDVILEIADRYAATMAREELEKAENMMLDRSIALMNEETAVKWDDVVAVIAALASPDGGTK